MRGSAKLGAIPWECQAGRASSTITHSACATTPPRAHRTIVSTQMNASVQSALDNLERNLQLLLESVASYNPSPAAAVALVQSDDELTATLKKRAPLKSRTTGKSSN